MAKFAVGPFYAKPKRDGIVLRFSGYFDFESGQFVREITAGQLKTPGCLSLHSVRGLQSARNQTFLHIFEDFAQGNRVRQAFDPIKSVCRRSCVPVGLSVDWKICGDNLGTCGQDQGALDEIAQLADITWKVVASQLFDGLGLDVAKRDFQFSRGLPDTEFTKSGNILGSLAQGCEVDGDEGEPVMEILPKGGVLEAIL
jgi:hypothetical protein